MKPKIIVVDIDGTIANNSHRLHLYHEKMSEDEWEEFRTLAEFDFVREGIREIIASKYSHYPIVFVTARYEKDREVTEYWLKKNNFTYLSLYMRDNNDFRPDYLVKKSIYTKHLIDFDILEVFEDNESCVKMYESLGLKVYQVFN